MTILLSAYTDSGIVFAADDRITVRIGRSGKTRTVQHRPQKKVQEVAGLGVHPSGGLIGFFGAARVKGEQMDHWLGQQLGQCRSGPYTAEFAEDLRDALNRAPFTPEQKLLPTGFHVAAFETRNGVPVPVFRFVWNFGAMDRGYYLNIGPFRTEEQLLERDYRGVAPADIRPALRLFAWQTGQPKWYRNGDVPFHGPLTSYLMHAIAEVVATDREFRTDDYELPKTLVRWSAYVQSLVDTTIAAAGLLFAQGSARIGGETTLKVLDWPT